MAPRGWPLIALVLTACGPRTPSRTIRFESTVHSSRLPNGTRVLVVEDHDTNLVELSIRLDVGSIDDPAGKGGLAHLVEHLMFQVASGPDGRPAVAHILASAIAFNAYTSWEATSYFEIARADQLGALLELEAGRFAAACPSIDPAAFEREREVVRNELRLRTSLPGADDFGRVLFPPDHPFARPMGGTDASVSRLTLDDACRFVERHYQPDRMVVMVTGDVDARRAIRAVAASLGRLARRGRSPRPARRLALPAMRRVEARGLGKGPHLLVEWPVPPAWSPDYPATEVAVSILDRALGQRGSAGIVEVGRGSLATVFLPLAKGADEAAVAAALRDVDRAVARTLSEVPAETLERLANRHARELLERFDSISGRVAIMAEAFQMAGDDHVVVHHLVRFANLDADDVRAAAARTFAADRRSVVVVVPPARPSKPPGPPGAATSAFAGQSHEEDWHAPVDPGEADRPLRMPVPRERIARAQRFRLDSGLTVIMLRTPAVPVVSARLVFAGGRADDPAGKDGLASLAAHLLRFPRRDPGRSGYTPEQALLHFGDALGVSVGMDAVIFSADGLSSHLDAVISGLAWLVSEGEYRDADLAALRARSPRIDTVRRRSDAHMRASAAFHAHLYGAGHPLGRAARSEFRAGGALIHRSDLERLRAARFASSNGVLVLTGQFDPALAREQIEHWFGDLRGGQPEKVIRPPAHPTPGIVAETTDPADPVTELQIGFAPGSAGESRALRRVVALMVEERMRRVREALGAAYSVGVWFEDGRAPGALVITAEVDPARSREAIHLMMEELDRLRAGGRDLAEAFARARRATLKAIIAESSGAASSADRIASLVARGEDLAVDGRLAREVMNLAMEDARRALADQLAASRQVVAIVGSPDSLAAARRAIDDDRERRPGVSPATQ